MIARHSRVAAMCVVACLLRLAAIQPAAGSWKRWRTSSIQPSPESHRQLARYRGGNSKYIPHDEEDGSSFFFFFKSGVYPYIPWKILRPCGRQRRQAERKDRRQYLRQRGTWSSELLKREAAVAQDRCIHMYGFTHAGHTHTHMKRMMSSACRPELGVCWVQNHFSSSGSFCKAFCQNLHMSSYKLHPKSGSGMMMWVIWSVPCQTYRVMFIIRLHLFPTLETKCQPSYCGKRHGWKRKESADFVLRWVNVNC